jgi:hypothetical protein
MFTNYRALEDAFRARNWEPLAEVFTHDPFVDPKDQGITSLLRDAGLEQDFPVASHGVAGFALHFRDAVAGPGAIAVALERVETAKTLAEWHVPFADIRAEWNHFALQRGSDGSPGSLRLRIRAKGGLPPTLSLGHPVLNLRYAARSSMAHGDLGHRPIAMRIFTGLPGVRPAGVSNTFAPASSPFPNQPTSYRLHPDQLRGVENVSLTSVVPDFQTVGYLEHENAIICHPLVTGLTAGVLKGAVASGTQKLSARAVIDHPEGRPAAAGLLLVPQGAALVAALRELLRSGTAPGETVFSGWREVGNSGPLTINMLLPHPIAAPMSLVLLSRAIADSVDYSWLKITDLRLEMTD